jgi:hypothetical protein
MAYITSNQGYHHLVSCEQLASRFLLGSQAGTIAGFPQCEAYFSGQNATLLVPIEASMTDGGASGAQAALNTGFGAAIWLSIFLHAIGVEFYVCPPL